MIISYSKMNFDKINNLIYDNRYQNVYLYIDSISYGFDLPNIKTWLQMRDGNIISIIYQYYQSVQLLQIIELNQEDVIELSEFLHSLDIDMISAQYDLIKAIHLKMNNYNLSMGYLLKYKNRNSVLDSEFEYASITDCKEIAELICSDSSIGGHYEVHALEKQLIDRILNHGCVNLIKRSNGKIIAHAATYAATIDIAVIGGVITNPQYRGTGIASRMVKSLSEKLYHSGVVPVLYCYNDNIINWYERIGWDKVIKCGSLKK